MNITLWVVKALVLIIAIFGVNITTNVSFAKELHTSEAEAHVFVESLVYSKNGLSYYDPDVDRVYPGIILLSKIQDPLLEQKLIEAFKLEDRTSLGAKFTLIRSDQPNKEFFYNSQGYRYLSPLAGKRGVGSADRFTFNKKIILQHNDLSKESATLQIEVLKK